MTTPDATQDGGLYATRQKIYPREIGGRFQRLRVIAVFVLLGIYYILPWIPWGERQAVLFDLPARKFHIFALTLWPQDFYFLTWLLVIAALSLFFFTALAGRLFCGYACPQTVYTQIFMWIENWVEGDRNARIKLDKAPLDIRKLRIKGTKHLIWGLLSLWTGFTLVSYFTPVDELINNIRTGNLGPWEIFWIFFYGGFTYLFAGFMREQVCKYMCPYARFQSVMFDPDTLVITYDYQRGEPRGGRRKEADYKAAGLGDCVDCGICVQVCPTGIDIRNGLQYMCIGCAACIDACDQVMEKMAYPKGLIRYSTENAIEGKYADKEILKHVFRPRTLFYSAILVGIFVAFLITLAQRVPLRVDVIRDRLTLSRETPAGGIENIYRLQIINMDGRPHQYTIAAKGIDGLKVTSGERVEIPALGTVNLNVTLEAARQSITRPTQPVVFEIRAEDDERLVREAKSSFLK